MTPNSDIAARRSTRFEAVVADVFEPLQRYLRRRMATADVDDVLDDALLVLWRRLDDVPASDPLPYAYGVARRCLANHRRGRARHLRLVRTVAADHRDEAPTWTSAAEAALHDALGRLPDLDREIVQLWAWERLEPREIAAVLDTTPNAISVRLTRIKQRLAEDLERKDPAPSGQERDVRHEGRQR